MTREPVVVRTLEDLSAHVSRRMAEAESANLAEAEKKRLEEADQPEQVPAAARVATLGLVPTMGALHEGHATLVRRAREQNDVVAVSVFVNPLQFGPDEDYDRYPRQLEKDVELLTELGADLVFAPETETMYPGGTPRVTISSGELGTVFEGEQRPGHFDGVLTVVGKLFNLFVGAAGAHRVRAYFGQKDAQQLAIVQRMVADLNIPVAVCPVAIVRDDDGLALSSRNVYLDPEQRQAALVLSRTLALLREEGLSRGYEGIDLEGARNRIETTDGVELDYLEVVDPATLRAPEPDADRALALAAIRVGGTRLLDNMDVV